MLQRRKQIKKRGGQMIEDPFKVIAADILYQRNEQLKRDLIKKAQEADKAKWARLDEQHLTKGETK